MVCDKARNDLEACDDRRIVWSFDSRCHSMIDSTHIQDTFLRESPYGAKAGPWACSM